MSWRVSHRRLAVLVAAALTAGALSGCGGSAPPEAGATPTTLFGEVTREVLEPASLSVVDVENLRFHYALTLRHWRERFDAAGERVADMFDEVFVRAWRLYLAGSEVGFTTGYLQLFQLTFAREDAELPWTRAALYR